MQPVLIMPSEWLPVALGDAPAGVPREMIELIMHRYSEIVAALNNSPPHLEPVFWQAKEGHVIAMDWCEGFVDAVAMRKTEWDAFNETTLGERLMRPILDHLFDENGVSLSGVNERELDAHLDRSAKQILNTVPQIFTHWQSKRLARIMN